MKEQDLLLVDKLDTLIQNGKTLVNSLAVAKDDVSFPKSEKHKLILYQNADLMVIAQHLAKKFPETDIEGKRESKEFQDSIMTIRAELKVYYRLLLEWNRFHQSALESLSTLARMEVLDMNLNPFLTKSFVVLSGLFFTCESIVLKMGRGKKAVVSAAMLIEKRMGMETSNASFLQERIQQMENEVVFGFETRLLHVINLIKPQLMETVFHDDGELPLFPQTKQNLSADGSSWSYSIAIISSWLKDLNYSKVLGNGYFNSKILWEVVEYTNEAKKTKKFKPKDRFEQRESVLKMLRLVLKNMNPEYLQSNLSSIDSLYRITALEIECYFVHGKRNVHICELINLYFKLKSVMQTAKKSQNLITLMQTTGKEILNSLKNTPDYIQMLLQELEKGLLDYTLFRNIWAKIQVFYSDSKIIMQLGYVFDFMNSMCDVSLCPTTYNISFWDLSTLVLDFEDSLCSRHLEFIYPLSVFLESFKSFDSKNFLEYLVAKMCVQLDLLLQKRLESKTKSLTKIVRGTFDVQRDLIDEEQQLFTKEITDLLFVLNKAPCTQLIASCLASTFDSMLKFDVDACFSSKLRELCVFEMNLLSLHLFQIPIKQIVDTVLLKQTNKNKSYVDNLFVRYLDLMNPSYIISLHRKSLINLKTNQHVQRGDFLSLAKIIGPKNMNKLLSILQEQIENQQEKHVLVGFLNECRILLFQCLWDAAQFDVNLKSALASAEITKQKVTFFELEKTKLSFSFLVQDTYIPHLRACTQNSHCLKSLPVTLIRDEKDALKIHTFNCLKGFKLSNNILTQKAYIDVLKKKPMDFRHEEED